MSEVLAIQATKNRARRLEDRICELRAVEYPTEAQMRELSKARVAAGEVNEWLAAREERAA
jgi:hypothetical protein